MAESNKRADADAATQTVPPSFAMRALVASVIFISMLALALFLWYSIRVVLLIFAGVLVAILLRGLSDWVAQWTKLGHKSSLAIVLLVLVGSLVALVWIAAPQLADEIGQLADRLPQAIEDLRQRIHDTRIGKLVLSQAPQLDQIMSARGGLLANVTGILSGTLGALVSVIVILFTGLFLAATPLTYVRGVLHLFPHARRDRMAEVIGAIGYTLKWWLIGQAGSMVAIGVATGTGLALLGVPLAFVLGVITALFNFIPNFGPLFGLVPALLLTLPVDPSKAISVVILFIVLQNLEGYILMPIIQNRAVHLPEAMTIITQVLMGILLGGLGLALAAPLAAATLVAVKMLYVEDTLGDRIKTPADGDARKEVREVKKAAKETERDQK